MIFVGLFRRKWKEWFVFGGGGGGEGERGVGGGGGGGGRRNFVLLAFPYSNMTSLLLPSLRFILLHWSEKPRIQKHCAEVTTSFCWICLSDLATSIHGFPPLNIGMSSDCSSWDVSARLFVHFRQQTLSRLKNKNQLDVTYYFIVLLIGSTCFGHYNAHHQELATIMLIATLVVSFLSFCRLEVRCD